MIVIKISDLYDSLYDCVFGIILCLLVCGFVLIFGSGKAYALGAYIPGDTTETPEKTQLQWCLDKQEFIKQKINSEWNIKILDMGNIESNHRFVGFNGRGIDRFQCYTDTLTEDGPVSIFYGFTYTLKGQWFTGYAWITSDPFEVHYRWSADNN